MCDCHRPKPHHEHHHEHHDPCHPRHHHSGYRYVSGHTNYAEVAVTNRRLPGKPAASLARSLGYNVGRRSGQQYFNKSRAFSEAYGYYN
jgi:hypothetical protein